jgi:hypothetical protein
MPRYTIELCSKVSDRDVAFNGIPANTAEDAAKYALDMLSAKGIWLVIQTINEETGNVEEHRG